MRLGRVFGNMNEYDWGSLKSWVELGEELGGIVTLDIHPPLPGKSYRRIVFKPRAIGTGGWEVSLVRGRAHGSLADDVEQAVCEIRGAMIDGEF